MDISKNTVVFKLTDKNDFSNLDIKSDIKNFIANLQGIDIDVLNSVKDKFITFGEHISNINGSFVIVSDFVFDDKLVIVPTLQEAFDYIEMEEIERKLDL